MNATLSWVEGKPRLAFEKYGSGPPLVFLHGIGGNRHMWRAQAEAFKSRFTVLCWDARGYGDSEDYDGPLDFSDFGNDLARLLDSVAVAKAHLVGLSMGARILMDFFPRYRDRVATLTLCDCFYGFETALTPAKQAEFIALRQSPLLDGASLEDLAPSLIDSLVSPYCTEEVRDVLRRSILALHRESYLKTIAATVKYDRGADLPSFDIPAQLIFGQADTLTPPSIGETMQKLMPDARLAVLSHAGHLSNLERPHAFNAVLGAFLAIHADAACFRAKG